MINYFSFNYNSRIIQEYFQAKIGKKVRTFSLAQKDNIRRVRRVFWGCSRPVPGFTDTRLKLVAMYLS